MPLFIFRIHAYSTSYIHYILVSSCGFFLWPQNHLLVKFINSRHPDLMTYEWQRGEILMSSRMTLNLSRRIQINNNTVNNCTAAHLSRFWYRGSCTPVFLWPTHLNCYVQYWCHILYMSFSDLMGKTLSLFILRYLMAVKEVISSKLDFSHQILKPLTECALETSKK